MNVASKDLSRELYELTKWVDDSPGLEHHLVEPPVGADLDDIEAGRFYFTRYTLGYLLRKLPPYVLDTQNKHHYDCPNCNCAKEYKCVFELRGGSHWAAAYISVMHSRAIPFYEQADTPEDAATKLCIELIKQGVISPNGEPTK